MTSDFSQIFSRRSWIECMAQFARAANAAAITWKRSPPERVNVSQWLTLASDFTCSPPARAELMVPLKPDEMWIERISFSTCAILRYNSAKIPLEGWAVVGIAG